MFEAAAVPGALISILETCAEAWTAGQWQNFMAVSRPVSAGMICSVLRFLSALCCPCAQPFHLDKVISSCCRGWGGKVLSGGEIDIKGGSGARSTGCAGHAGSQDAGRPTPRCFHAAPAAGRHSGVQTCPVRPCARCMS